MPISNSPKFGVPISLLKDGKPIIETTGDSHWTHAEVKDNDSVALGFIEYLDSVYVDLLKDPKRRPLSNDFDTLQIEYTDCLLEYTKDELICLCITPSIFLTSERPPMKMAECTIHPMETIPQ